MRWNCVCGSNISYKYCYYFLLYTNSNYTHFLSSQRYLNIYTNCKYDAYIFEINLAFNIKSTIVYLERGFEGVPFAEEPGQSVFLRKNY